MILTVAIPTFNRAPQLSNQINSIISQMEGGIDVELLISDNDSSDNTSEVCNAAINENPKLNINYYKNDSNIGFDLNVHNAISKAKGSYVWILSDDDNVDSSSLGIVFNSVKDNFNDFSVGFINYRIEIGGKYYPSLCGEHNQKIELVDKNDFFRNTRLASSFISSNIFKKDDWLSFDFKKYKDVLWVHLFASRDMLIGNRGLIICQPLITQVQPPVEQSRHATKLHESMNIEFYLAAHILMGKFCSTISEYGYSEELKKIINEVNRTDDIGQIITYKISNSPKKLSNYYDFFNQYLTLERSIADKTKVLFLLSVPSFIYRFFRYLKNYKR